MGGPGSGRRPGSGLTNHSPENWSDLARQAKRKSFDKHVPKSVGRPKTTKTTQKSRKSNWAIRKL